MQESWGFFGLNSFLACCCAGELWFLWLLPTGELRFFGLNSFLACFHGRRVTVSLATSHRRVAVLWVELFLGLLLCRRVTVSLGYFPQESCGFFGLHRSTSWCLVFSFLPRSCFCCQIYQLFFWFSLHTQVYISRLYKVQTL